MAEWSSMVSYSQVKKKSNSSKRCLDLLSQDLALGDKNGEEAYITSLNKALVHLDNRK